MKKLSKNKIKLLNRYIKSSTTLDRFSLFKQSAIASNELLTILEDTITKEKLTANDYTYLNTITRKKARNYKKLTGIDTLISMFSEIKDGTLKKLIEDKEND